MRWLFLVASILAMTQPTFGADWSDWEIENSVARERDWLVIRQPGEGFCYLKQSYDSDPSKMEMTTGRSRVPTIVTPFFQGIRGNLTYQVDDQELRVIPAPQIEFSNSIELPRGLIPALKVGRTLTVRVTPVGEQPRTQTFSLLGFTAASRWLDREVCQFQASQEATGDGGTTVLDVRLERIASGKVQIVGDTSLPDGMRLFVGLRNPSVNYFAEDKLTVSNGAFRSAAISNRGTSLPDGTYEILIWSLLPSLQPASVRSAIGPNGERLSGPAVVKKGYTSWIYWTVRRDLR